jgi:hypothetical protein
VTLRARSSSDVRIFINDTVSFYLWQARAGFFTKSFEILEIGIAAAGFATRLGRRSHTAGGRLRMKQRHAKDRERKKIMLANADSMPGGPGIWTHHPRYSDAC